jgi:hypothetical protein
MAEIYNPSTLTISAVNASSDGEGFLRPRIPLEDRSARIPYRDQIDTTKADFYICEPLRDFDKDLERGPLNSRGWTLQERILARRNVFFGQYQLHLECRSIKWSESTRLARHESIDVSGGISSWRELNSLERKMT